MPSASAPAPHPREFRTYQEVRRRVLRMKEMEAEHEGAPPSAYWREELATLDYVLEASPPVVAKLRHHCHTVTGLRPYEYRTNRSVDEAAHRTKLRALVEVAGDELLVPERRELGGFGFEIDGRLINRDTLKFFEALIALERGGVLRTLREGGDRRVVWEIGAGWGGFAYQLKALFPHVTVLISDLPELFIFSAVYLQTLFPQARLSFHGDDDWDDAIAEDVDFAFVPHGFVEAVRPRRLDLTVNMVSFQEMTEAQVRTYVDHAHALGCPFLYSLNRERSPYNEELKSVSAVIRRRYWPHEIPVLPVDCSELPERVHTPRARYPELPANWPQGRRALGYRHLVAWRRQLA
jgi:hypothetical protein